MQSKQHSFYILHSTYYILFLLAFLERTVFDFGPNIELLTSALVLSSYYFGAKRSLIGILAVMIASDLIIGNTNIFIFTWSGFLIPVLFLSRSDLIGKMIAKRSDLIRSFMLILTGVSANLFFFFWSNFGVWFLDSWGMYSKDFQGLVHCYFNALPFLRHQIISTLIFIPTVFFLIKTAISINKNKKFQLEKRIIQILNRTGVYRL